MSNYYVSKDKESDKWKVLKEGAKRASELLPLQKQAEAIAKRLSANSGGSEVRIKGLNGKFRDSDTVWPGKDPCPPKDKKH